LPNPVQHSANPYVPVNSPAIGDLFSAFRFDHRHHGDHDDDGDEDNDRDDSGGHASNEGGAGWWPF
jgi:phospholipase C